MCYLIHDEHGLFSDEGAAYVSSNDMKLLTGNKITRANTIRIKAGFVNSAILSL